MKHKVIAGRAFIPDKKNGGGVILNKARYDRGGECLAKVDALFNELSATLAWWNPEPDGEFLLRVYREGVAALKSISAERFEQWAAEHDCPQFLLEEGKRKAVAAIPADLLERVQKILNEIHETSKATTLPFSVEELEFDSQRLALRVSDAYAERFRAACEDKVGEEDVNAAKRLCDILLELRKIDSMGYAVPLLVQRFIGNRYKEPSDQPAVDLDTVMMSMRRYPILVISKDEAEAAGGNRLETCRAITDASLNAAAFGYYSKLTPNIGLSDKPQTEGGGGVDNPGRFAGVTEGLRELGFEV